MTTYSKKVRLNWRIYFILGLFVLASLILVIRLVDLQVIDQGFLRTQGDARMMRTIGMAAYRGMLTDRNGEPLAVSAPVASLWMNPSIFLEAETETQKNTLAQLSRALDIPIKALQERIHTQKNKEFVYLKRQVNPQVAQAIEEKHFPGVYLQNEFRRYYPAAEVTAQLIGFTNVDDQGQEGLELGFNKRLTGRQGAKQVIKDRLGNVIEEIAVLKQPQDGEDVILSLDRRLQYLLYRELKSAMLVNQAKAASAVLLDVDTGEVLAIANVPSFNPNNREDRPQEALRNRVITDLLEPGSVFKTLSMAAALENKVVKPGDKFETAPGYMQVGRNTVKDIHNYGELDLAGILQHSSNVGITQVVWNLPPYKLVDLLRAFGFGESTHSGFPGEREGVLSVPKEKDKFGLATLSFGYGASVTLIQLADAYATLASGGLKKPVTFLKVDKPPKTERVLSAKVAEQLNQMLVSVVDSGAFRAKVAGYTVAGKTGTVRKLGEHGYEEKRHMAIFAGFAPASKPRFALVVMIDDPQSGGYYGGVIAAPVFSQMMAGALRLADIAPDARTTLEANANGN